VEDILQVPGDLVERCGLSEILGMLRVRGLTGVLRRVKAEVTRAAIARSASTQAPSPILGWSPSSWRAIALDPVGHLDPVGMTIGPDWTNVPQSERLRGYSELRRETISIDRQPASGSQTADTSKAFQDQQFTIQLKNEEPVVEKRVVQSGQVVASKKATTEQTTVQREIRKDDVAIDKGNAQASGGATGPGGESQGSASGGTITDLKTLAMTTDVDSMHGKSVRCSNVKVQQVMDATLITVGGEGNQPEVCVHLQQPAQNLKAGDTVTITGTVKESSKATDITGGLSSASSQTLNSHRFFIECQSCEKGG
jgi:hypothetical protein